MNRLDLTLNDLLGKIILKKKIFQAILFSLFVSIIPLLYFILANLITGWSVNINVFNDFGYINTYFLALPILVIFLNMYVNDFCDVYEYLLDRNIVIIKDKDQFHNILENKILYTNFNKFSPHIFAVICSIIVFSIFVIGEKNNWYSLINSGKFNFAGILILLPYYIFYFVLWLIFTRLIMIFRVLKLVFNQDVKINPLHHDQCGGFSILGKISQKFYIGAFLMGIILINGIIQNSSLYNVPVFHTTNIAMILGYLTFSTLVFFLPLFATSKPMRNEKEKELGLISDYSFELNKRNKEILRNNLDYEKQIIKNFRAVNEIGNSIGKMSIYPFNTKNIAQFFTSLSIPLIMLIINTVITKLL